MRALINAYLRSYGGEEIPVGVASIASRREVALKTLHEKCGKPITLRKWCNTCSIGAEDTVKGWERVPGSFVVLDDVDIEATKSPNDKMITITSFMPMKTTTLVVERDYWLLPPFISDSYWVFHAALRAEKAIGVGTSVLWGKESPCAVMAYPEGLCLSLLFYAQEVAVCDLTPPRGLDKGEVGLAQKFIAAQMTTKFDPKVFTPPTRTADVIAKKMAKDDPLLKSLKKSLKATKPKAVKS